MARKISEGAYFVDVECPRCEAGLVVAAELHARLVVEKGKPGEIRLGCTSKAQAHRCTDRPAIVDVPLPGIGDEDAALA